jgi:hypothetical protein
MSDESSRKERDARSLAIQAQIESESRRAAWEQKYGPKRKSVPIRADVDPPVPIAKNSPLEAAHAAPQPNAPTIDACTAFQRVSLSESLGLYGVYGILHRNTGCIYVGSSSDIVKRLRKHISDLEGNRHHSPKLQGAWNDCGRPTFEFVFIEKVVDFILLRDREQHWIDQLGAYAHGFNSKSRADGPELSLASHIENAKSVYLPIIYARLAPKREDFTPNDTDRQAFRTALRRSLSRKVKQAAISGALVWAGIAIPNLRFIWLAVIFYFLPVMLFNWPDSPTRRADRRYFEVEASAEEKAKHELIQFIAGRLGLPEAHVATAYPDAPKVIAKRKELSKRYRRDRWLREKAQFNRERWRS